MVRKNIYLISIMYLLFNINLLLFGQIKSREVKIHKIIGSEKEIPDENDLILYQMTSIATNKENFLYILDAGNHRLLKFDDTYELVWEIGREGQGPGEFGFREGMINAGFVSSGVNRSVYVLDNVNQRVQKFDETGKYSSSFTLPWTMNSIAVNDSGEVILGGNSKAQDLLLHKFSPDGEYVLSGGSKIINNPDCGFFNDFSMDVTKNGDIYFVSKYYPVIRKYNRDIKRIWEKEIEIDNLDPDLQKRFKKILFHNAPKSDLEKFKGGIKELVKKYQHSLSPIINDCLWVDESLYLYVLPNYLVKLNNEGVITECNEFKLERFAWLPKFTKMKNDFLFMLNDVVLVGN